MRFSLLSISSVALLVSIASLAACSSSNDSAPGTPEAQGQAVVKAQGCTDCHGTDLSGSANGIPKYPTRNTPNLTPDKDTGVGGWSDVQLKTAIRTGVDDEGAELCAVMPRFKDLSDSDVDHVIAYLRSLPAVSKEIPDSECPKDAGADSGSK